MTSRITIDTTTLSVRDVFCYNRDTNDYIQPFSIPVIGSFGKINWYSSLEFLSTISVPTGISSSDSILNLLQTISPGLSSLSTTIVSTAAAITRSTVAGLGSLPDGNDYISSSKLNGVVGHLSLNYGYISSTTLYDCFTNLGNMRNITDFLGPMAYHLGGSASNLSGGYVSTMNPGQYKIYKSSIGLQGSNVDTSLPNGGNLNSGLIDITGYSTNIVNTSQMRIDINANIQLSYAAGSHATTFSTILVNPDNSAVIGNPVRLTFNSSNATIGNLSFLINSTALRTPFPSNLQLKHVMANDGTTVNIRTGIPEIGGIFVTLDNTD
jgi:hypothetical protein